MKFFFRFFAALAGLTLAGQAAPSHVYLTWQGDTSTTITVNFQTADKAESYVYYDTESRGEKFKEYRFRATGRRHQIEGLPDGRWIHWVELTKLKPGETYYFLAGDPKSGFAAERKFQTIPAGSEKLRFVEGGDMGTGPAMPVLLKQAGLQGPNFGVVGGDIAYAGDILTNYSRWDAWLDAWEQNMITPKGFTVPMVLAIGNHEVRGGSGHSPTNAVFYFQYFAQDKERGYYSRTFGKNLAMYMLDSGHITPQSAQAAWLEARLKADANFPWRFAVYHVPLYPSVRAFDNAGSAAGRDAWLAIFDQYHLTTAFEHHDHAFKRTHLLRDNKVDAMGTLYLGDGCWGQRARSVDQTQRWYEEKAASIQHFWVVDVTKDRVEYRAVDTEGKVFDVYPPDVTGAAEAEKVYEQLLKTVSPVPAPAPATK